MRSTIKICAAALFAAFFCATGLCQERSTSVSPEIHIGHLDNGMTYYLSHQENPKGCADFYIAHNVGALQEEDNQNGLAHFLEHMAFNGTKHYPGKELLNFLAKEGVRFGYNVNAYTSKAETVYNISSVPLVRDSFVDSTLMILHDWSCDISCEQQDLDDERGVISDEWRRSDDTRSRMARKQTDLMYRGSKHTQRSVLGTLEIINGFRRDEILDFYHTWYRPDLQALIVVGDFDVPQMEKRIQRLFSDIAKRENPKQKEHYAPTPLSEPLMENMNDPEIKYYTLKVIHKRPFPQTREPEELYRDNLLRLVASSIVEARFNAAIKKPDCPVRSNVLVTRNSSTDFYSSLFTLSPKSEKLLEETLAFYEREIRRSLESDATEAEVANAIFNVEKKGKLLNEIFPEDIKSEQIVNVCKEHFLRGFPCLTPIEQRNLELEILGNITRKEVVEYIHQMFGKSEKIYSYNINEKKADILPSKERMNEIIAATATEKLEPEYVQYPAIDLSVDAPKGRIVSCRKSNFGGIKGETWKLSNGVTVKYLPSDKVKSNIHLVLKAYFPTGYNYLDQSKLARSFAALSYAKRYACFSSIERDALKKTPEFAAVDIQMSVHSRDAVLQVTSDQRSLETAFRSFNLQLDKPNFGNEFLLNKYISQSVESLSQGKTNKDKFEDTLREVEYYKHPWHISPDADSYRAISQEVAEDVFRRMFGNVEDMTLLICSDLDKEQLKEYVANFVASLPTHYPYKSAKLGLPVPQFKGKIVNTGNFNTTAEPKSSVDYCYKTSLPVNSRNDLMLKILDHVMSDRCLNQIREVRGGTYSVSFSSARQTNDQRIIESDVAFTTRPSMTSVLVGDVETLMSQIAYEGPSEQELSAAKKYLAKKHIEKESANANSLKWKLSKVEGLLFDGTEFDFDYESTLDKISAKDIQKLASRIYSGDILVGIFNETAE